MKKFEMLPVSRRTFMAGCAGCMLGTLSIANAAAPLCTLSCTELFPAVKPRVRLVFSHIAPDTPTWPNIGYDYEKRKKDLTEKLQKACPDIEFLPITTLNQEEAKKMLAEDKDIDGYLVYMLGLWTRAGSTIAEAGKPVIFADDLYGGSGEFLTEYSRMKRNNWKVAGISSSKVEDAAKAARSFVALKKMRHSTILDVTDQPKEKLWGGVILDEYKNIFGADVQLISSDQLNQAYIQSDKEAAKAWASHWIKKARKVVEPSREEIEKSAGMYLALQKLLKEHKAQAITIDCLGLFYSKKMQAYPCLGFFQLNNDGLIGACESDLKSTLTMLAMTYLTGMPGYISDPVIDTSKNQIIYAHCVAMNKVHGPNGRSNSYDIRSHSEDRKGAVVRSLMPLHEMTTTLEIDPTKKAILMHQAITEENVDEDKACRTKVAARVVGDINKLMTEWDQWGWHRVTFFGDHKKAIEDFAALTGLKVIYEA